MLILNISLHYYVSQPCDIINTKHKIHNNELQYTITAMLC